MNRSVTPASSHCRTNVFTLADGRHSDLPFQASGAAYYFTNTLALGNPNTEIGLLNMTFIHNAHRAQPKQR